MSSGDIDYTEYDRITDTLMWLSDNVSLTFTVALSRKGKSGDRIHYHSEYQYGSDKYGNDLRSIKRNMNFYFVIDVKTDFVAGMLLRPQDVELILRLLDMRVMPWFLEAGMFTIRDNKLVLGTYEPVVYDQGNSKTLAFEPAIYVDPYSELESRGIRMSLTSGDAWVMSIDQFMGFYYILKHTDMYSAACALCNYTKIPPYGINSMNSKGLGAVPQYRNASANRSFNGFNSNSFLDNAKQKGE